MDKEELKALLRVLSGNNTITVLEAWNKLLEEFDRLTVCEEWFLKLCHEVVGLRAKAEALERILRPARGVREALWEEDVVNAVLAYLNSQKNPPKGITLKDGITLTMGDDLRIRRCSEKPNTSESEDYAYPVKPQQPEVALKCPTCQGKGYVLDDRDIQCGAEKPLVEIDNDGNVVPISKPKDEEVLREILDGRLETGNIAYVVKSILEHFSFRDGRSKEGE